MIPVIIGLQSTKVYVFSDSVLCLGKVLQHPECNEAWKSRVAGVRAERNYRDFEIVSGESTEFEWNIFPGFTSLQLCDKISDLLSSLGQSPETFTGRILFMSMFNDISCEKKGNKEECLKYAACLAAGGGPKRRYQYFADYLGSIIYLCALQGHSGDSLVDFELQDNVLIGPCDISIHLSRRKQFQS